MYAELNIWSDIIITKKCDPAAIILFVQKFIDWEYFKMAKNLKKKKKGS